MAFSNDEKAYALGASGGETGVTAVLTRTATSHRLVWYRLAPLLILVVGGLVTAWGWAMLQQSETAAQELRFQTLRDTVTDGVSKRMQRIDSVLGACRGLFAASKSVEREEWQKFVTSLSLEHYPGALGLGFIRYVPDDGVETFVKETRADGAPAFAPHHLSTNQPHLIITYIEPLAPNQPAEGLDISFDPLRKETALRAMRTGGGALTRALELIQDGRGLVGFLYLLPVYLNGMPASTEAERNQAIQGWVYAPIRIDDMVGDLRSDFESLIDFKLLQAEPNGSFFTLYESGTSNTNGKTGLLDASGKRTAVAPLSMAGQQWKVVVVAKDEFESSAVSSHSLLLVAAGFILTILLSAWVRSILNRARQVEHLVADRTAAAEQANVKLAKANAELRSVSSMHSAILTNAGNAIVASTPEGIITLFNPAAEKLLGYSADEMVGKLTPAVFHCAQEVMERARIFGDELGVALEPGFEVFVAKARRRLRNVHEWIYVRKDGARFPGLLTVTALWDEAGEVVGFLGLVVDISDHKKLESELRLREEQFRAAMEHSPIGMALVGPDGRWIEANPALCEIVGYTREELLKTDFQTITHPDDLETDLSNVRQMLERTINTYRMEKRYIHRNRSVVWIELSVSLVWNEDGTPRYFIAQIDDITEKRAAADKLRSREELLRQMIRHTPAAVAMLDTEMRYLQASERWLLDYHLEGKEIIGRSHYEVFPDIPERWKAIHRRVLAGAVERCDEDPFERSDGSTEWLQWEARPWFGTRGEIGGVIFFTQVITARKRMEQELQRASAMHAALLNAAGNSIIAVNAQGVITVFNPASERLFGYTAEELVGKSTPAIFHEPEEVVARAESFGRELGVALKPGFEVFVIKSRLNLPNSHEWTFVRKDGSHFPVLLTINALRDETNTIIGFIGLTVDLTDQKRAEEELRVAKDAAERANANLADSNRQLEEAIGNAQDMAVKAEAANRAKSGFLAAMSHEIRTPMNGVLGFTSLLLDTPLDDDQRDFVQTIRTSGETLLILINDILDFSKIEADRLELESLKFELRPCLEECVKLLAPKAAEKKLQFDLMLDSSLPQRVVGDCGRIRQILLNLLSNAIKFTHEGGIRVEARHLGTTGEATRIEIKVSDTGIGIPEDKLNRLFQPFTQVDASTSRNYGGTGLGLAISRRLAEAMDGTITVQSVMQQGTTFRVVLKVGFVAESLQPSLDCISQETDANVTSIAPLSVLVAEDSAVNQRLIMAFLKKLGYRADMVGDGIEAVDMLAQRNYDVILMDVHMPRLDGLDTTRRIRAELPPGRQPYIIAVTASVLKEETDACFKAGMDLFISKPVMREDLREALAKAAEQHRNGATRHSQLVVDRPTPDF